MSVEHADRELKAFLEEPSASAVALTGRWGVGKTYAWRKVLAKHQQSSSGKVQPYSYVSLFGVGSIEDVKTALFTQMRTFDSNADGLVQKTSWLKDRLRPLAKHREALPTVFQDWVPDLKPLMFMAVKDWLICFDDLERRTSNLDLQDLMGLVSFLREERNCKVLVIANDEAFEQAGAVFRRNFEKVFDQQIAYEPTPIEAGRVGAPSASRAAGFVRETVELLGITNIRVILKLAKVAEQVGAALAGSQDVTVRQIVRSIVLIGWSVLEPELAPSTAYIKSDWMLEGLLGREPGAEERAWAELLRKVEFQGFKETEALILAAFAKGYLDGKALVEFCASMDAAARRSIAREPFLEVLAELDNEWGGDTDDLMTRLSDAMTTAGTNLYITDDVNRACSVFEALQRHDLSEKQAHSYVQGLAPDDQVIDPHYNEGIATYVAPLQRAIEARRMPARDERSVTEFLESMLEGVSTTAEMERLEGLTADDFYEAFRTYRGRRLRHHIRALRHHHPQTVRLNVEAALQRLGAESPLNAYRFANLRL